MGYPTSQDVASVALGIPIVRQTSFLFERAIQLINTNEGIERVLALLTQADAIEQEMVCARKTLLVDSVGNIHLRTLAIDQLEHEYNRWVDRLADTLGCPRYQYSVRSTARPFNTRRVGSVPVRR
jgi:hypothetical protein